MAHMFFFHRSDLRNLERLINEHVDGQYFILNEYSEGWVDICQWSEQYQNVKFLVTKKDTLDERKRMW